MSLLDQFLMLWLFSIAMVQFVLGFDDSRLGRSSRGY